MRRGNLVAFATILALPQDCFVPSGDYLRGITLFLAMTNLPEISGKPRQSAFFSHPHAQMPCWCGFRGFALA